MRKQLDQIDVKLWSSFLWSLAFMEARAARIGDVSWGSNSKRRIGGDCRGELNFVVKP